MAKQGTSVRCDVCGKYVSARGIGGHRRLKHQLKVKNIYKTFQDTNHESQLPKPNAWVRKSQLPKPNARVRTGNNSSTWIRTGNNSSSWVRTGSQLPELVRRIKSVPSNKIICCTLCENVIKDDFCYGFYEVSEGVIKPGFAAPFCRDCMEVQ